MSLTLVVASTIVVVLEPRAARTLASVSSSPNSPVWNDTTLLWAELRVARLDARDDIDAVLFARLRCAVAETAAFGVALTTFFQPAFNPPMEVLLFLALNRSEERKSGQSRDWGLTVLRPLLSSGRMACV